MNELLAYRKTCYEGSPELYGRGYRTLSPGHRGDLPKARLIIGNPLRSGLRLRRLTGWFPEFSIISAYCPRSRRLRGAALFLPFQDLFEMASREQEAAYWGPDGVHPSAAGAYLMASAWLDCVAAIDE